MFLGLAVLVAAGLCMTAGTADARSSTTRATAANLTLYSVATEEQFVNNEDDRARGKGHNPFGNYKDETTVTKEGKNGPFPGDEAIFQFAIYSNASLKARTGTAIFVCQYNFLKNAFCDASYRLQGGTLIAAGAFNFNATRFTLAVTGGTGKYTGLTGDLSAAPGPGHAQRLNVDLG